MPSHLAFQDIAWIEKNFKEILPGPDLVLDMKYASLDNFMNQDVYQGFKRCFLSGWAFEMFENVRKDLREKHPQLQFRVWDALRPRRVQALFYNHLEGTQFQHYVAAPEPGSLHNFGMALDLTLQFRDGEELDMGTGFDDFRDLAQPQLEDQFLSSGELSEKQFKNRMLLRQLMQARGFKVLDHEWWHFNALAKERVYGRFAILD